MKPQKERTGDATCREETIPITSNAAPTVQPPSAAERGEQQDETETPQETIKRLAEQVVELNAALAAEKKNYAAWRLTINETHRQELAAERRDKERWRLACNSKASHDRIFELEQELVAERQRSAVRENQVESLNEQLLSAQAVIEKHRDALEWLRDFQNGCPLPSYEKNWNHAMELADAALKSKPDLSLLHQHDAEIYNEAWKTLHQRMPGCGHPRACWQDRNYPESEKNYDPKTKTSEPPIDYRCAACEREAEVRKPLVKVLEQLQNRIKKAHGFPNFGSEEIREIDAALKQ